MRGEQRSKPSRRKPARADLLECRRALPGCLAELGQAHSLPHWCTVPTPTPCFPLRLHVLAARRVPEQKGHVCKTAKTQVRAGKCQHVTVVCSPECACARKRERATSRSVCRKARCASSLALSTST